LFHTQKSQLKYLNLHTKKAGEVVNQNRNKSRSTISNIKAGKNHVKECKKIRPDVKESKTVQGREEGKDPERPKEKTWKDYY